MLPKFEHIGPWEVFLLFLLAISAYLVIGALSLNPWPVFPYVFTLAMVTVWIYMDPPEQLSPPVFWVLVAVCFPFTLDQGNFASIVLWGLIASHLSLIAAAMPLFFRIFLAVVLPVALLLNGSSSVTALLSYLAVAFVMFDKIHFLMHPGYWVGWVVLEFNLAVIFAAELPPSWNIVGFSAVALMLRLLDPARSMGHFALFVLATIPLIVARFLFPFVYIYPETYLFPFNLISHRYKVASPVWFPIGELENAPNQLCTQCTQFTSSSNLIMGTFTPLVSLVEWHKVSLCSSSLAGIEPCDLCPLIWHSAVGLEQLGSRPESDWKIKVWQERPISRYVFMKLYYGDQPVGPRYLVHRGKSFNDPSPSTGEASTASALHESLAKSWLDECKKGHERCNGVGTSPRRAPTRLIYVESSTTEDGSGTTPKIKLILTDSDGEQVEYFAFSHCWGGSSTFQLLQKNYKACQESIDFSALSKNMRDAINITLQLGCSYIWIDSLCIIQDSAADWRLEAARMESVYAGASCTLASTGSATGDGGCFHDRANHRSLRPCRVAVSATSGPEQEWTYVRRDELADFSRGIDRAPLNRRGWVLQERLLSRRILHFGAEMLYWECSLRSASELCPKGFVYKQHPTEYYGNFLPPPIQVEPDGSDLSPETRWKRFRLIQRRLPQSDLDIEQGTGPSRGALLPNHAFMRERRRHSYDSWQTDSHTGRYRTALDQIQDHNYEKEGLLSFAQCWYTIVESYSRSSLSFSTDRLIAIQGIVQEVQRVTNGQFVAGLWSDHLVECLLWFMVDGPGQRLMETIPLKRAAAATAARKLSDAKDAAKPAENDQAVASSSPGPPRLDATKSGGPSGSSAAEMGQTESSAGEGQAEHVKGPQMAPSWSWVSVAGPVTIDQLPTNSNRKIFATNLAIACSATASTVQPSPDGEKWNAVEGVVKIEAPLARITRLTCEDDKWYIHIGPLGRRRSARLIPDLVTFAEYVNGADELDLVCVSLLALRRETEMMFHIKTNEVQGLVVRRLQTRQGEPDLYERVGFFSTALVEGGSRHLGHFKGAQIEKIHVI